MARAVQAPLRGAECQRVRSAREAPPSPMVTQALTYPPMNEPSSPAPAAAPCPNCGAPASGRFCSNCGAPLGGVACGACGAELAPGAKFCHRCGTPVAVPGSATAAPAAAASTGAPSPANGSKSTLPWAVAAIAVLALVAMFAGQRFAQAGSNGSPAAAASDGGGLMPSGPAPDISQMSPEEQAQRLYDLMMRAYEGGHTDTLQMFAPMATAAYERLDTMTLDDRYDLGRLGEITGNPALAAAEADTILKQDPNHLLGLILAAEAAGSRGDSAVEKRYLQRLLKVAPAEQRKKLPEYQQHENDIKAALAQARKG